MKWTWREWEAAQAIAGAWALDIDELSQAPRGTGMRSTPDPMAAQRKIALSLTENLERASTQRSADVRYQLSGLAHSYEIETTDELWRLKAIVRALLDHPYFAGAPGPRPEGAPRKSVPQQEANLQEFWIQANRLQAMLEISRGSEVSSQALADEMARRQLNLSTDQERWTSHQADRHIRASSHRRREIGEKTKAFARLLAKYDFNLPLMRKNSTVWSHSQSGMSPFKWAPSETELADYPDWQKHYRRLRERQVETARSSPKR